MISSPEPLIRDLLIRILDESLWVTSGNKDLIFGLQIGLKSGLEPSVSARPKIKLTVRDQNFPFCAQTDLEESLVVGEERLVGADELEAVRERRAEHRLLPEEDVNVLLLEQHPQHLLPQRLQLARCEPGEVGARDREKRKGDMRETRTKNTTSLQGNMGPDSCLREEERRTRLAG